MSKVYATVNQFVGHGGQSVWIGFGDQYDSTHPLVKANPDWFTKETPGTVAAAEAQTRSSRRGS